MLEQEEYLRRTGSGSCVIKHGAVPGMSLNGGVLTQPNTTQAHKPLGAIPAQWLSAAAARDVPKFRGCGTLDTQRLVFISTKAIYRLT